MLIAELMDVPADRPRLDEDPMTQLRVGVRQTFPRGDTRRLNSARERTLGEQELARAAAAEQATVRAVRRAYLQLHYQRRLLGVLEANRRLFTDLAQITEREFASGRAFQQDMLRAELELERLEDRLSAARSAEQAAQAELARLIGADAQRPLAGDLPELVRPGSTDLLMHPVLAAEDAGVRASQREVELARQSYRPQWTVEFTYGRPTASGEMQEPDRLSGMVMVDLPLFTRNRQDRQVAASLQRREAAEHAHEERLRALQRELTETNSRWQRLSEREQRFGARLLPTARANADAADQAYRASTTTFAELMRARIMALETELDALRVAVERRQAQADLLYLLGEEQS
jgi:outer membrane protein TolC